MNGPIIADKNIYIRLCADVDFIGYIPLFAQPFWLDAVAEKWDVLLYKKGDAIIATLPYCIKGRLLTKRIYLPDLSFYQSVLFFGENDHADELQNITESLFHELPYTVKSYFKLLPAYSEIDLSSLHYERTSYSSYFIDSNTTYSLSEHHRRNLQKGIKNAYHTNESQDIPASFQLLTATFSRQRITTKISEKEFEKTVALCRQHHCGKVVDCTDAAGNLLASAFIVYDTHTAYYLMGGYNAAFKNSGAMTFLLQQLIAESLQKKLDFNFCGSSKKSIAQFFEGFGAQKKDIAIWTKSVI